MWCSPLKANRYLGGTHDLHIKYYFSSLKIGARRFQEVTHLQLKAHNASELVTFPEGGIYSVSFREMFPMRSEHAIKILNLGVCILLRVLDQVQGFPSNAIIFVYYFI
jgi:hypothetical protein